MPAHTIIHNAKIATNTVPIFVDVVAVTDSRQRFSLRQGTVAFAICLLMLLAVAVAAFPQDFQSPLIRAPYAVDFGRILLGKTSDSQAVTVFNNGGVEQAVSSVSIDGDFSETDNCPKPPAPLPANAECVINVTFKPSRVGTESGTLTIHEAPSGLQLTVTLSGTGTAEEPSVAISPTSLAFPEVATGSASQQQTITVMNTGKEDISVSNVEASGDFMISPESSCVHMTAPLAPNAKCTVQVVFAPVLTGQSSGEVVITDNAKDSPQHVPLSGTSK